MTQKSELQVTITLGESSWRAIEDLLYHACQLRGRDWIRWQREMAQFISKAIETARVPDEPYMRNDGSCVYPDSWDDQDISDYWCWIDLKCDSQRDREVIRPMYGR